MRQELRWSVALPVLAVALAAHGQGVALAHAGAVISSLRHVQAQSELVREIDDPHTGVRWLLMRNSEHPGGPGVLEPAGSVRSRALADGRDGVPRPVLRAGERLIAEEDTPLVTSRLEAVALGSAVVGSTLYVRLKFGGKVVRAVAAAPGRAVLRPEEEPRP